jgi:hypothetical protein
MNQGPVITAKKMQNAPKPSIPGVSAGTNAMAVQRTFRGFFSYARHDADTNPGMIRAFTADLERHVNAKLLNAEFTIWLDKEGIRTGELWTAKLDDVLHHSDIFILLVTPKWIESDYCSHEYEVFEEVERLRSVGEYVVPILARPIDEQDKYFTQRQREVYTKVTQRQYFKAFTTDFLKLPSARRSAVIDEIADDIAGMTERLRELTNTPESSVPAHLRVRHGPERINCVPEDYREVDFLRSYEVVVDRLQDHRERGVYAQVDFVERLFIETRQGYIEFGVKRASLSIHSDGPGRVLQSYDFRIQDVHRAGYVTLRENPYALSIVVNAEPGKALAERALPPTDGKYWSRIATATPEIQHELLRAELRVAFSARGLHIINENMQQMSQRTRRKIEAIVAAAINKHERIGQDGQITRSVPIQERIP